MSESILTVIYNINENIDILQVRRKFNDFMAFSSLNGGIFFVKHENLFGYNENSIMIVNSNGEIIITQMPNKNLSFYLLDKFMKTLGIQPDLIEEKIACGCKFPNSHDMVLESDLFDFIDTEDSFLLSENGQNNRVSLTGNISLPVFNLDYSRPIQECDNFIFSEFPILAQPSMEQIKSNSCKINDKYYCTRENCTHPFMSIYGTENEITHHLLWVLTQM